MDLPKVTAFGRDKRDVPPQVLEHLRGIEGWTFSKAVAKADSGDRLKITARLRWSGGGTSPVKALREIPGFQVRDIFSMTAHGYTVVSFKIRKEIRQ